MKRIVSLIISLLAVAFIAISFVSCNKDFIETDELSNTTWSTTVMSNDGHPETLYLMFLSNHAIAFGTQSQMVKGTYSYDAPNVVVNIELSSTETGRLGGVVTGDKMTLSDGSQQMIFRKN